MQLYVAFGSCLHMYCSCFYIASDVVSVLTVGSFYVHVYVVSMLFLCCFDFGQI